MRIRAEIEVISLNACSTPKRDERDLLMDFLSTVNWPVPSCATTPVEMPC